MDTTVSHSDIAWNFEKFGINPQEDFKYGREPDHLRRRRLAAEEESRRRRAQGGSVGPPPVNLGYNPPLVWNQRMFFLLNNYHSSIPHSYNIPDQYFRSEAYMTRGTHPEPLDGKEAIEDRVCSVFGLNLYDAGTWTIALALQNEFEIQEVYNRQILYSSTTGRMDEVGGIKDIRGDTSDFKYGKGQVVGASLEMVTMPANMSNPMEKGGKNHKIQGAFFYRMIAPCYRCEDPLIGNYAESFRYNQTEMKGKGPSWNTEGAIVWNDWKPITGEQAWAMMVGPMNYLLLKNNGTIPRFKDFASAPAEVQLAISILPAMVAMQSGPGSMYHCPAGSDMWPADESEGTNVSNENNFSGYAGLRMLEFVLANNTDGADATLTKAKSDVDKLIAGLEKWFEQGLFSDQQFGGNDVPSGTGPDGKPAPGIANDGKPVKIVYQGGHVSFGGTYDPVPIQQYSGFAVDCQTWGMATMIPYMGLEWLEGHLGPQGAYNLWSQVKLRAGHYVNGTIAGVAFTQDLNLTCVNVTKPKDNLTCTQYPTWSGEWSYGAMTAVKVIADAYEEKGTNPALVANLRKDAASMRRLVNSPRKTEGLDEVGGLNNADVDGGILYANRRFFIPWGWYANAVSSLCATSWSVMEGLDFNPFVLGGNSSRVYGKHVPPKVRVKAMATGKSAGFYEPYPTATGGTGRESI